MALRFGASRRSRSVSSCGRSRAAPLHEHEAADPALAPKPHHSARVAPSPDSRASRCRHVRVAGTCRARARARARARRRGCCWEIGSQATGLERIVRQTLGARPRTPDSGEPGRSVAGRTDPMRSSRESQEALWALLCRGPASLRTIAPPASHSENPRFGVESGPSHANGVEESEAEPGRTSD